MNERDSYLNELARPWKILSLGVGIGLLIAGSFYYTAPDWDIPISLIMAGFAYFTAGWSMHVMVERRWKDFPLMLLATWWTVDGCYSLYWYLRNPAVLDYMRAANAPASLSLYWMCGLVWFWNGSLKELLARLDPGKRLRFLAAFLGKAMALLLAMILIYLAYLWWDMSRLRAFCQDIGAGTPVAELPGIAGKHGVDTRWLTGDGVFNEKIGEWSYYVPSTASVGANVCAIHHNKVGVISAEIEID